MRLRSALHALYLMFNEDYATSAGPELARPDLSCEPSVSSAPSTPHFPTTGRSPGYSTSCCSAMPAVPHVPDPAASSSRWRVRIDPDGTGR